MQQEIFEDIINKKMKLTEYANSGTTSKQYIYDEFKKEIDSFKTTAPYIHIYNSIVTDSRNIVKEINLENILKDMKIKGKEASYSFALNVFKYIYSKHIFEASASQCWFSTIKREDLNTLIRDTLTDLKYFEISKALTANNIVADESFLSYYGKTFSFKNINFNILSWAEAVLIDYMMPMDKDMFLELAINNGYSINSTKNLISLKTNNQGKIMGLGDKVAHTDTFFKHYVNKKLADELVSSSVSICKKYNIYKTDVKWISSKLSEEYPSLNFNQYNKYELKAILCDSKEFEKGAKLNITYLENKEEGTLEDINDILEDILQEYHLPVSFGFIVKKIKERGRMYSRTSLSSIILSKNKNIVKIKDRWLLKKYEEKALEFFKKIEKIPNKLIISALKEHYQIQNVKNYAELSEKTGIESFAFSKANYYEKENEKNLFIYKLTIAKIGIEIIDEDNQIIKILDLK